MLLKAKRLLQQQVSTGTWDHQNIIYNKKKQKRLFTTIVWLKSLTFQYRPPTEQLCVFRSLRRWLQKRIRGKVTEIYDLLHVTDRDSKIDLFADLLAP